MNGFHSVLFHFLILFLIFPSAALALTAELCLLLKLEAFYSPDLSDGRTLPVQEECFHLICQSCLHINKFVSLAIARQPVQTFSHLKVIF